MKQFDVNFFSDDFSKYRVTARLGGLRSRCFISHVGADDNGSKVGNAKERRCMYGCMNYRRRLLAKKHASRHSPL